MSGFNYLRESPPEMLERLRPSRVPESLRTPLAAFCTASLVVAIWWSIEQLLLGQANDELHRQRLRLLASRAAVAELRLRRERAEELLAIDARLREIRRSGAVAASRLADIANHVPGSAWLTSIARVDDGIQIDGRALGIEGVRRTMADLMSSRSAPAPALLRASRDDRERTGAIIAFTMRVQQTP